MFQILILNLNYHKQNIKLLQKIHKFNKINVKTMMLIIHQILKLNPFYFIQLKMVYDVHYIHLHVNIQCFAI